MTTETHNSTPTVDLNNGWDGDQPIITQEDLDDAFKGLDNEDDGDAGTTEPIE